MAITVNNTVTWKATIVNCYQTTWQHTTENRILHKYFRHNEKVKDEVCTPMEARLLPHRNQTSGILLGQMY
jgi:hypothetical protein